MWSINGLDGMGMWWWWCSYLGHRSAGFKNGCITYIDVLISQNKEGILPSSDTVYCFICSPQIYVSQQRCARGVNFVIGFININKYTSASENVHLCLRTVNWVTLVSLLVEYLLYSVLIWCFIDVDCFLSIWPKSNVIKAIRFTYWQLLEKE